MYDNYDDACEATITQNQAIREIHKHGMYKADFFAACGEHDEYSGKVILDWLGY